MLQRAAMDTLILLFRLGAGWGGVVGVRIKPIFDGIFGFLWDTFLKHSFTHNSVQLAISKWIWDNG